jgi:hypothetical protein
MSENEKLIQQGREEAWKEFTACLSTADRRRMADDLAHGWILTSFTTNRPSYNIDPATGRYKRTASGGLQPELPFTAEPRVYAGVNME